MVELEVPKMPQVLSPCNSRRSNDSNSPEFEFWMVRNPSFPQQDLHSADELFSGGVLLPLHQLQHQSSSSCPDPPPPPPTPLDEESGQQESAGSDSARPGSGSGSGPDFSAAISNLSASGFTSSKRWKDIFKKSERKCSNNGNDDVNDNTNKEKGKEKVKKKEKRNLAVGGGLTNGVTAAELNINLWPFRRSRSAGNGGNRQRNSSATASTRKVSSAPCSRSNSAGESKSRKWPSSPSRGGVHLGRSSTIWQVRRTSTASGGGRISAIVGKSAEKGARKDGNESRRNLHASFTGRSAASRGGAQKGKILNLNVPTCIGYRSQLSCRSDENSAVGVASVATGSVSGGDGGGCQSDGAESVEGVRGGNLFNIRSLFTKKVY